MRVDTFIDTGVLLCHLDDSDARKHAIATRIVRDALTSRQGCISAQVVQECLRAALDQAQQPLDPADAAAYFGTVLAPLWRVMPTSSLFLQALEVQSRCGLGYADALIVAAALEAGCTRLISEDLPPGPLISGLRVENPFL